MILSPSLPAREDKKTSFLLEHDINFRPSSVLPMRNKSYRNSESIVSDVNPIPHGVVKP